jgi:hypothetical protein
MPFQIAIEPPERQQMFDGNETDLRPSRVEHWRTVSLREHETVIARVLRVLRVEMHSAEEQRRHMMSAAEQQVLGWPEPASVVELTE